MNLVKRLWPYLTLLLLVGVIAATNYVPGTILTGGDNLHPEYNFAVNIRRSLFAVWQEYQGLGLLGGMGHSADLLRQLFLLLLSSIVPTEALRYLWTFLTLFIGASGAYSLIMYLNSQSKKNDDSAINHQSLTISLFALLGAIYYLLNLSTVQSYYTAFEVFMAHYAFLPWLLLAGVHFLTSRSKKALLIFALLLLLATPASYVPTLFIVFILALGIVAGVLFFRSPKNEKKFFAIKSAKLLLLISLINSFWALPFAYFTLTKSGVNVGAKINQMATETIFLLNKESGTVLDAMLLKGFWFNNVEPNFQGINSYMLSPWRDHIHNPVFFILGLLLFAVILIGVISSLSKRSGLFLPFAIVCIVAFCMLVTATPPFSWLNILTREVLPLFSQVFRFPFTKFSILLSLMYAIFFVVGLQWIQSKLKNTTAPSFLHNSYFLILTSLFLITLFVLPIFRGHLFYDHERLSLPQEYKNTFAFFKEQDKSGRIALLPVNTFWDWKFYSFGYRGSGFWWYGIEQPILDRAFDVWSRENENYYNEISQAVYAKDGEAVNRVLQKYQIRWLLLDKNIIYPTSPKSLFYPELEQLLSLQPSVRLVKSYNNLSIYQVTLSDNPQSFVYLKDNVSSVNSYVSNDQDIAYAQLGTYQSTSDFRPSTLDHFYPFRSLFSRKTQNDLEYSMQENEADITIVSKATAPENITTLTLPSFYQLEQTIPAELVIRRQNNTYTLYLDFLLPAIRSGESVVYAERISRQLLTLPSAGREVELHLDVNGIADYTIPYEEGRVSIASIPLRVNSFFTLTDSQQRPLSQVVLPESYFATLPQLQEQTIPYPATGQLNILIPKVNHPSFSFRPLLSQSTSVRNCDRFRQGEFDSVLNGSILQLTSKNATTCIAYYSPRLTHAEGYAIFVDAANLKGRSLHTWVLNEDEKYAPFETYLPARSEMTTSTFILPPQDQFGSAYSIHFDNNSIGDLTENDLKRVALYPIPYRFLTAIRSDTRPLTQSTSTQAEITVNHPHESSYTVEIQNTKYKIQNTTLVLSQGFDPGWNAYVVEGGVEARLPMFFGTKLEHVKINNWSNGWKLDSIQQVNNPTIVITYLPQYLQYLGFILLIGTLGVVTFLTIQARSKP